MKNVLFVALVTIQLAPSPSSPKNMTFIALSVMRTSLPLSASNAIRLVELKTH